MLASRKHGALYILPTRISQHREGVFEGFTKRYGVKRLVWFETHDGIEAAIHREKRLKAYPRQWKVNLIEHENSDWLDLYPGFFKADGPLSHLQPLTPSM